MLLLGKTQKKHLGDLPPMVPDLPPPAPVKYINTSQQYAFLLHDALCMCYILPDDV